MTGLTFNLPEIFNPLDYFVEFVYDNLWDLIVKETNRYTSQKLSNSPEHLANFVLITRAEIKAFMGINIIMGIAKLPQVALYWSSDDYFGNQGIKKVMFKNRFEEIGSYLHLMILVLSPLGEHQALIAFIGLGRVLTLS